MAQGFFEFLELAASERKDVFDQTAGEIGSDGGIYVEKDFWVSLTLDLIYNRLPDDSPGILFKGGTSLSKAFGAIRRFSEDIDLVISRESLGFTEEHDPTNPDGFTNKQRKKSFEKLQEACSGYICGNLAESLAALLDGRCTIEPSAEDGTGQTLHLNYPTLYPQDTAAYIQPRVKIEAGARSALSPATQAAITPNISGVMGEGWSFAVNNINTLIPERTYLEKLLILHGLQCGYRDEGRIPVDRERISRHYYDVAMITETAIGKSALENTELLAAVREHNLIAFRQAWKKFEEAVPGSICLTPKDDLFAAIRKDYDAMAGMILGEPPGFDWVMAQIAIAEEVVNARGYGGRRPMQSRYDAPDGASPPSSPR